MVGAVWKFGGTGGGVGRDRGDPLGPGGLAWVVGDEGVISLLDVAAMVDQAVEQRAQGADVEVGAVEVSGLGGRRPLIRRGRDQGVRTGAAPSPLTTASATTPLPTIGNDSVCCDGS